MAAIQLLNCVILFLSLLTQDLTKAANDVPRTTYSLWSISGGGLGTEEEEEEEEEEVYAAQTVAVKAVVLCSDATRGS